MTHTLHRMKGEAGKRDDYVVLVMPARGINNQDQVETFKRYYDLLYAFEPLNMGGIGTGNLGTHSFEELKENLTGEVPMMHAVYRDRETLIRAMKALREADLGFSVVVSGLLDDVDCCAREAGIQRHSVDISLGVWGALDKLPGDGVLEITTMCGHAMISANLVMKMVEDVKAGRTTAHKAGEELSRPCACGVFNVDKAERLLTELAAKWEV